MSLSSILNGNIVATPIKITPEQINVVFKSSSQPTLVKLKPSATLLQEILFKKVRRSELPSASCLLYNADLCDKLTPSTPLPPTRLFSPHHSQEKQGTDDDSSLILSFLRSSDLQLTSESGAEYSYYNVSVNLLALALKTFLTKVGLGFLLPPSSREFHSSLLSSSSPLLGYKAEVISPASERQIQVRSDEGGGLERSDSSISPTNITNDAFRGRFTRTLPLIVACHAVLPHVHGH